MLSGSAARSSGPVASSGVCACVTQARPGSQWLVYGYVCDLRQPVTGSRVGSFSNDANPRALGAATGKSMFSAMLVWGRVGVPFVPTRRKAT